MKEKVTKFDIIMLIVAIVFFVSTVTACIIMFKKDNNSTSDDSNQETVSVEENTRTEEEIEAVELKYINYSDIESLADEKFIIVIVKEMCSACTKFKYNLKEFSLDYTVPVYLVDSVNMTTEQMTGIRYFPTYYFYIKDNGVNERVYSNYGNTTADELYKEFLENAKKD